MPTPSFNSDGQNVSFLPFWSHGAGAGGHSIGYILEAGPCEWENNADRFLSIIWGVAPSSGQPERLPAFQFTFLEYFGLKTARAFTGKRVTVSWLLRSSGCGIAPVMWRAGLDIPVVSRFPWPNYSMQLWTGSTYSVGPTQQRVDLTINLPAMPPTNGGIPGGSYLGVGLDMVGGPSGPSIDIAAVQMNEGDPCAWIEQPFNF